MVTKINKSLKILYNDGIVELAKLTYKFLCDKIPFHYKIRYRNKLNYIKYGVSTEPLTIYWVDPTDLQWKIDYFSREKKIGTVKGGDWDKNKTKFDNSVTYIGLYERFVEGCDWEQTQYYDRAKKLIEQGETPCGYSSIDLFREHRCSYIDQLYQNIKENGYKTQNELNGKKRDTIRHDTAPNSHIKTHEIGCNIGRDGKLLINTGYHRLSIAKILDLDQIPVQIIVRHDEWQKTRSAISRSNNPKEIIEKKGIDLDHPDLQSII